jgi:hypothetical protein
MDVTERPEIEVRGSNRRPFPQISRRQRQKGVVDRAAAFEMRMAYSFANVGLVLQSG